MMEYDVRETVPKPTVELVINSEHAVTDEVFLEQGKYTFQILVDRDEEGVACFVREHLSRKREC